MSERETRSGIPGQATRCADVAREQRVDEAHARSRVRPCVRADAMRAESSRRPAVATADPLRRAGHAHLCGVRLRGSAQLADVELVEGQLENRVRGLGVMQTVPEQVGRVVAGRDRAVARREVDRGGESRVADRLVLIRVVE